LATEIATALLRIAWTRLHLPNLVCWTGNANLPSRRVMQKVGFSFERTLDYEGEPCVLYRIHGPTNAGPIK
jgi:RimJ/RimL family protein N-acetyltransferase